MITVQDLAMHYGDRALFESVNFQIQPGVNLGIVGANGAGKSTLLKILSKDELPTEGQVIYEKNIRVSRLEQETDHLVEQTIHNLVLQGNSRLWQARLDYEECLRAKGPDLAEKLEQVQEVLDNEENYTADANASRLLSGLGFSSEKLQSPLGDFSGGYRLRVMLARALFARPDLLLLDEPTNHLDLPSIEWLIQFLKKEFRGVFITVSHNRDFLGKICNSIADVDFGGVQLYKGSYSSYRTQRDIWVESKEIEKAAAEKKIKELQGFVDRFRAKASKARQAQSRVKQIDKIEMPEIVSTSRRFPEFSFQSSKASSRHFLQVRGLSFSYESLQVLERVQFELTRGAKMAIVGPNGSGKSTLLKLLADELVMQKGDIHWGSHVVRYYFPQDPRQYLHDETTLYEWLRGRHQEIPQAKLRSVMGSMLFSRDDVKKKSKSLSGGEASRLVFADCMLSQPNVLLLDEPTNHLDLESVEALELALADFEGSCILVSHDRSFLENVATSYLYITGNQEIRYTDQFPDTLESLPQAENTKEPSQSKGKDWYQQRKEILRQHQRLVQDSKKKEAEIAEFEAELNEIETFFLENSDFSAEARQLLTQKQKRKEDVEKALENSMNDWETLTTNIEKLEKEYPKILINQN